MQTSIKGITLIQGYEKCKLKAYADSGGVWTIGWGTTYYPDGSKVKQGDTCSQQQADTLFANDLKRFERKVEGRVARELLPHEFDAAVCFCYNAGTGYHDKFGKYKDFNLWAKINNRDSDIVPYWKTLAVTSEGKTLAGLQRRRKSESTMYATGELNFYS